MWYSPLIYGNFGFSCHYFVQVNSFSYIVNVSTDVFAANEVDLNMFLTLDDADLKELGIKIFGHRKRILMAIKGKN